MNKKEILFAVLFALIVTSIFFVKGIFRQEIPFPGDFLIASTPFKTESYLGYPPGGYPNKAQGRDVIAQLYPWKYFSISQMKSGSLPLWNPYNFSGNVHIANYQTGVFYPFNILFFILPFITAWSVFIFLQPLLALIFMYLFLRSIKISRIPSIIGSIAFAFSSYMIVWLEWGNIGHTILWLPLMLFCMRKYILQNNFFSGVFFIISAICCLLAGYIQGAFYVFLITAMYGFCLIKQEKGKRKWIGSMVLFLLPVAASSIQLLPTLQVFATSARGAYTSSQVQNLLNPWYYPVTLFVSEFFGNPATRNFALPITYYERVMYTGIPILFFALYALQKVRNFELKFFGIAAAIALVVTTNLPGISLIYSLPIPVLSTTVPTRFLSIFIFSVIVVGVFGIEYWMQKKDIKSFAPYFLAGMYVALWGIVLVGNKVYPQWFAQIAVAKHTLILSSIIASLTIGIFFLRYKFVRIAGILLVILVVGDLFYLFNKFTPFAPASLVYPKTPVISYLQQQAGINRSWGYASAYMDANYATQFGIYGADGYDSLFSKEYGRLLNSSVTGKVTYPLSRTDANIAPSNGGDDLKRNVYRQKMLDVLGVKYIPYITDGDGAVAETGAFPPDKYQLVWHTGPWQIYENKEVFPRYFLVGKYTIVHASNDIKNFYTSDLRNTVLLYEKPSGSMREGEGKVVLQTYQPNRVAFRTTTATDQLLFLSDTYDSGWIATIDGIPTKLYKADVALRAVVVPQGRHKVVMSYQPRLFRLGLIISLLTVLTGGLFLLVRKLRK